VLQQSSSVLRYEERELGALYAVFGVGIGNFGRGRARSRRPMARWVQMLNERLLDGDPAAQIIGVFGHTGNFLVDSPARSLAEVSARFHRLLDTDWVVRRIEDVRAALVVLADAPQPTQAERVRWTPGFAFGDGAACGAVSSTSRAVLWRVSSYAIGAWKRDNLSAADRLDPGRRAGGWGAVSNDIHRQIGGQWTARSRRTLDGLIKLVSGRR